MAGGEVASRKGALERGLEEWTGSSPWLTVKLGSLPLNIQHL